MMPPFVVFPTNRIAHFVEVSLYLFYLAQRVKLEYDKKKAGTYSITAVYKSARGTETESEPYTITVLDN